MSAKFGRVRGKRVAGYDSKYEKAFHEAHPHLVRNSLKNGGSNFIYFHPMTAYQDYLKLITDKTTYQWEAKAEGMFKILQKYLMHKYSPDFRNPKTGLWIETKGVLTTENMPQNLSKWRAMQLLHGRKLVVVLQAPNKRYGSSKIPMTYGDKLTKEGIEWLGWKEGQSPIKV
jgi:hypothetical protein